MLEVKSVLVIGGTGEIGRPIVKNLLMMGVRVGIIANSWKEFCQHYDPEIPNLEFFLADVRRSDELKKAIDEFAHGGLQAVVHCVGHLDPSPLKFEKVNFEKGKEIVDINMKGTLNVLEALSSLPPQEQKLHFIYLSSLTSIRGYPEVPFYSASKRATELLIEAFTLRSPGEVMQFSTVKLGYVQSPMVENFHLNNHFWKKISLSPAYVAKKVTEIIYKPKTLTVLPRSGRYLGWWFALMPKFLFNSYFKYRYQKVFARQYLVEASK